MRVHCRKCFAELALKTRTLWVTSLRADNTVMSETRELQEKIVCTECEFETGWGEAGEYVLRAA